MLAACIVAEDVALVMMSWRGGAGARAPRTTYIFVDKGRSIRPYVLGLVCQHGCSQTKATGQRLRSLFDVVVP